MPATVEQDRLERDGSSWKRWGPYLAERAWGTVREDYSADGNAWKSFPHDHARSRAYRWNEDGLAGICDDRQFLCFALALWNGRDPILKERLFGLDGPEGNHGEDVKEYYFYLDSTPTHSYMKMLYKYPQAAYPYDDLVQTNARRGKDEPEYELFDTGIFTDDRYFDVFVEYAKAGPDDILIRITVANRGLEAAPLHLLPTLWFRNAWSWEEGADRPSLWADAAVTNGSLAIRADHAGLGRYTLACDGAPELLFTENETNTQRLFGVPSRTPYVKDGIDHAVIHGLADAVNPALTGTKAAARYRVEVPAGGSATLRLRLAAGDLNPATAFDSFETIFAERIAEADAFYAAVQPAALTEDERRIQRQAFAGLLWSKQFFYYDVATWLRGDVGQPPPPAERRQGRNREWRHLSAADIISMPDTWEYPWFASWDLAFHCVPLALVDLDFAKEQLMLMCREWYQHPNGQLPAYEWNFGDVNPPVLPWAAGRLYRLERERRGAGDHAFLSYLFQKLSQNFTWWVNRKDPEGNALFEGGFLGLDNIGVFDRSAPLPSGVHLEQSDGTSWMAMYCIYLLAASLELARDDPAYAELATKYLYHFMYIAAAMDGIGEGQLPLWDAEDKFFYDVLHAEGRGSMRLKVRSMVGLIPLFAVATVDLNPLPNADVFRARVDWFVEQRPALAETLRRLREQNASGGMMVSICRDDKLLPILQRMLDEDEFLSPYGVRALPGARRTALSLRRGRVPPECRVSARRVQQWHVRWQLQLARPDLDAGELLAH
jgi:hypothetical protein